MTLTALGVPLADPNVVDVVDDVEVLIGSDYYFKFVLGHKREADINLLRSPSGFMIVGPMNNKHSNTPNHMAALKVGASVDPLDLDFEKDLSDVPKLWSLENLGINDSEVAVEDTVALDRFSKSIEYSGGQYWVNLPFKTDRPCLPDNKGIAYSQLKGLLVRLKREPELLAHYNKVIAQLKELDFIEEVGPAPPGVETHHLPHHGVKKDSASTPLRVVFNASSKSKNGEGSLNDCLLTGPNLIQKLVDTLLKFRVGRYGYTADISKAFLRVGLKEEDRDFTRFLWKVNPEDINSRTITFRFKAVLFGATCSPFLLQATLDHHFHKVESPISDCWLVVFM